MTITIEPTHFCGQCGSSDIEVAVCAYMNASAYFAGYEGPLEIVDGQDIQEAYCGNCGEPVLMKNGPATSPPPRLYKYHVTYTLNGDGPFRMEFMAENTDHAREQFIDDGAYKNCTILNVSVQA